MNTFENEIKCYKNLNKTAVKNGVVFFGSTFAKNIPVCELSQNFGMDCKIYNRSFTDLSVSDAADIADVCIKELEPSKILLQLGETDIERGWKSVFEIIGEYESLIKILKKYNKKAEIVIVSVCSEDSDCEKLNSGLEALAKKLDCQYADVTSAYTTEQPTLKAFGLLKYFIMGKLSFYDAMHLVNA